MDTVSFHALDIQFLMTVNHRFYLTMDGLSQEKKVCLICISLDTDMIINRRSMIFTGFAARLRCFRDMHWETGGADIINTQKKAIWS